MFERYTESARRVIFYARTEANHRDEAAIGPQDILLGLTWETKSGLTDLYPLKDLAVDLRARMGIPHLPSTAHPYLRVRDIPLDMAGKRALAHAAEEADRDWQYWIDCDHLLRGLLRFPNQAKDALTQSGITLAAVRKTVRGQRELLPRAPGPKWGREKLLWRRYGYVVVFFAGIVLISLLRC